ncbi:Signal transduction histidine kinase CheA [hydrothermal vent metagenome]|uniref:Chemotaxis protein CheA n=1 Tax=hydrothermal vent metagenome TaxID=652676 RepID=A0A3B1CJ00_9ZZZZ
MDFDKSQFFDVFYEETAEHLVAMEGLLLNLDVLSPDSEELNAIFRAVHSIKGGAGTFGFDKLTKVAHAFETVLDKVRKSELALKSEMVDIFLEGGDVLKEILEAYKEEGEIDMTSSIDIIERLKVVSGDVLKTEESPKKTKTKPTEKTKTKTKKVSEVVDEEEKDLGFGFFDDVPPIEDSDPESHTEVEAEKDPGFGLFNDEESVSGSSDEKAEETISSSGLAKTPIKKTRPEKAAKAQAEATSIRIGVEKVDQLFNQVGEIVITQAMLAQTASHLDPAIFEKLENGLVQLERNTRDLQESVMAIRMVPIRMVFSRFPRLVRDMKKAFKKELELVMIGEETEIDKGFIEKLSDPLTHLLRNSFDHGIESPEDRKATGKDPMGTIILEASHQGGNVVIEVRDNGAGLNRERILAKAAEQGMSVPENISDAEVWNLIFAAGFSTAKKVSDISGRGVGMDVVKKNVQSMGGMVEIESEEGVGSRFIIRLPLTLAIIEGMVVKVGKEVYILPITSIVESMRPKENEIKTVMERGELVNMRGEYLPIVRLAELFGTESDVTDPTKGVLSVIESDGGRVAVLVDELLGQQQVVIKSMETNFKKVNGIAGATILGDGHVAFIIDVRAIRSFAGHEEQMFVG